MNETQMAPYKDISEYGEYFVALCDCRSQRTRREKRRARDRRRRGLLRLTFLLLFAAAVILVFCALCRACSAPFAVPSETAVTLPAIPVTAYQPDWSMPLPAKAAHEEQPILNSRYSSIEITAEERDELAAVVYLEARNQSAEGQQAVVEVVLNRVLHSGFPGSVHDVLHEGERTSCPQFSTIHSIEDARPTAEQYDAIDNALSSESILPADVVFFSREGENDRVWGKIGDHVFCYEYIW